MKFSRKRLGFAVGVVVAFAAAAYGHHYWTIGRFLETTDDAYIVADYTVIAPKVSGYITTVLVQDNQQVRAGDVLAHIDPRDFETALAQANADVASVQASIESLDAKIVLQSSIIAQAQANVASAEAAQRFAAVDQSRYAGLAKKGFASQQIAQRSDATLSESTAQLIHNRAAVAAAKQQLAVLQQSRAVAAAQLLHNEAVERQANLNLSYTTITAPIDGMVGARSLRIGQYVQAGTQLMTIVPLKAVYVVANYKETQLTDIQRGQAVTIAVDSFPGLAIHGDVDSISPASGLEFSLLPPDNATGNFTKIVQRIPVKVVLRSGNPLLGKLRPGMSVEVTVNTKPGQPVVERPANPVVSLR